MDRSSLHPDLNVSAPTSNEGPFHFLTPNNTAAMTAWSIVKVLSIHNAAINMISSPTSLARLPPLVATYVEATNNFDLDGLLATFADDALVNDQLRDHWGRTEIREWAQRDIVGKKLTLDVTDFIEHYGNFVVTAKAYGNFDKRGLPNPFVLALYFTVKENRIVQLMILPSGADL